MIKCHICNKNLIYTYIWSMQCSTDCHCYLGDSIEEKFTRYKIYQTIGDFQYEITASSKKSLWDYTHIYKRKINVPVKEGIFFNSQMTCDFIIPLDVVSGILKVPDNFYERINKLLAFS